MPNKKHEIYSIIDRYFPKGSHPYHILKNEILSTIRRDHRVLEIGCGRSPDLLNSLIGYADELIGIDVVDFNSDLPGISLFNNSASDMKNIDDASIDLAYSRSVMEHINDIAETYNEINRVLKSGARYIFITPNMWDYATIISYIVPNIFHRKVVKYTEGREEHNTFPVFYKTNTKRKILSLSRNSGLELEKFTYLGQYPSYFFLINIYF